MWLAKPCCSLLLIADAKFTFSGIKGKTNNGGGIGWSIEGKKYYDYLYFKVKADRKKHTKSHRDGGVITFNKELYNLFQQRRFRELETTPTGLDSRKPKKETYSCVDESADSDADSHDESEADPDEVAV